ncbi:hypothetical protein SNE40_016977 [Patella caerulea]|uniref:Arf-GAP with Rho-GAP domain, ANK repeat and PH domain-containing protein 1 n=1 Tax=Patella caerulea TaxID=87958 RepID=A0AAN8PEW8_PATCE
MATKDIGEMGDNSPQPPDLPPKSRKSSIKENEDLFHKKMPDTTTKPVPKPRNKSFIKGSTSPAKPTPIPRLRTSSSKSNISVNSANSSLTEADQFFLNTSMNKSTSLYANESINDLERPESLTGPSTYANEPVTDTSGKLGSIIGPSTSTYASEFFAETTERQGSITDQSTSIYANEPITDTTERQGSITDQSTSIYANEPVPDILRPESITEIIKGLKVDLESENKTDLNSSSTSKTSYTEPFPSIKPFTPIKTTSEKFDWNDNKSLPEGKGVLSLLDPLSPVKANPTKSVTDKMGFDSLFDPSTHTKTVTETPKLDHSISEEKGFDSPCDPTPKVDWNDTKSEASFESVADPFSSPQQSTEGKKLVWSDSKHLSQERRFESFPDADSVEQMIDWSLKQKNETVPESKTARPLLERVNALDEQNEKPSKALIKDPIRIPNTETSHCEEVVNEDQIYETLWVSKKQVLGRKESSTDDFSVIDELDDDTSLTFVNNRTVEPDPDTNIPTLPTQSIVGRESWGEYAYLDPNSDYVSPPPHYPPPPLPSSSDYIGMPSALPPPLPTMPPPLPSHKTVTSPDLATVNAPPVPPRPRPEGGGSKSSSPVPPTIKRDRPIPQSKRLETDTVNKRSSPIPPPLTLAGTSDSPPPQACQASFGGDYIPHDPIERQESDVFKGLPTPKQDLFQDDPFKYSDFATECYQFNKFEGPQGSTGMTDLPLETDIDANGDNNVYLVCDKGSERKNSDNVSDQSAEWFNRISLSNIPPPPTTSRKRNVQSNDEPDYVKAKAFAQETSLSDLSDTDSEEPYNNAGNNQRVPIITRNLSSPKNERVGYLYKQGGVKANKGWRRRWVVFNGRDLRYYVNNKSQISKRIIPLACMTDVVNDVKTEDTSRFKFKLITTLKDRVFHFAADELDDCLTWSQTIMAAIYQKNGGTNSSEDLGIRKSDKEGFIKFENGGGRKYFVSISESRLCYFHNRDDYLLNSPIHEIMMELASVKDASVGKNRLQLSTHYGHFILSFESATDCQQWKMAMEDAIAEGLADDSVLEKVYENESNRICADCEAEEPHWASINLGIVVCKNCAGIHRMFEVSISKIRSLRMDTRVWTPSLIELMKAIGNANANSFWESDLLPEQKIDKDSSTEQRKHFIQNKYRHKRHCQLHPAHQDVDILNQELLKSAGSDNVLDTMAIVFSGANVLYHLPGHEDTAYAIAKRAGERLQVEFLYQNFGDESTSASDDDGRLREDVRHQGYLLKTGPNFKGFDKRWCILEHGALTYYDAEKHQVFNSTTAKDSIERKSIYCLRTAVVEKQPAAFELSTSKNNQRIYLFAADNERERILWLQALAKLICPVVVMDHVGMMDFSLAGNFYMKDSVAEEWRKTWVMLNGRNFFYLTKESKLESVDLRKASSIKHQSSETGCSKCTEVGYHFVVNAPGRALYIQADLSRDTERLRNIIENAIKGSGITLEDQQLTSDNVPVIVDRCINFITNNGLRTRGIYRESATNSRVQSLLQELRNDPRCVRLEEYTDHEVANAVKRFFRGLTASVFTQDYKEWIQTSVISDLNNKLAWYGYLLDRMPEINYSTLKKLVLHLRKIGQYTAENAMSVENLATCFAPSLVIPDENEPHMNIQTSLPCQLSILMDIITHHDNLFRLDQEKSIEDKMEEAEKKINEIQSSPRMSKTLMSSDSLLIPISMFDISAQCEMVTVTSRNTASEVIDYFISKRKVTQRQINIHEILFKGQLERPLHWTNPVYEDVCRWGDWSEDVRKGVCLCLKPTDLIEKIATYYDPSKYLLSDLKCSEKKSFKKYTFDFKQSKFSCYKDSKASNCLWGFNAEDMIIYLGVDPRRSSIPSKYGFTFITRGEKPTKKESGYFGRSVCFASQNDLYTWVAALLMAKYPEGLVPV